MERVDLILEALAFSAETHAGTSEEATSADADLKGLVKQRFDGRADAELALAQYQDKPEAGRALLTEVLASAGVVDDFAIVLAAQKLMKLIDPEGAASGKYSVRPRSLHGMQIGH